MSEAEMLELPPGQVEIGGVVYRSCTCRWSELDISQAVPLRPVQCRECGEAWATPDGGLVVLAEDVTDLRAFLASGGSLQLLSGQTLLYVPSPEAQDRGMIPKMSKPGRMVPWPGAWWNHRGELVPGTGAGVAARGMDVLAAR
jgi:hypothetical protein